MSRKSWLGGARRVHVGNAVLALSCWLGAACSEDVVQNPNDGFYDPVNQGMTDAATGAASGDAGGSSNPGPGPGPTPNPPLDGGTSAGEDDAGQTAAGDAGEPDAGDDNYGLPPFEADGAPLDAPDRTWTWVDFPDSFCRDGSTAGIALSLNRASPNVMIYLEGGGACFDSLTCLANPSNASGQKGEKRAGLFNRQRAENPVKDWNFVYVPYCTGDVHAGTNANGNVPGVGPQKFVGYLNMQAYLKRVVPTFPNVERVLLTGVSAGGFGASANAVLVQRAFRGVRVSMIDDSGPPMPASVLPSCLQEKWRTTWGLDDSMLTDCGADCPNPNEYTFDYGLMLARKFGDRAAGLIEAAEDSIIRGFFGAGLNNCTGTAILTSVPAADFRAGLLEFRSAAEPYANFGTWYPAGGQHTWLSGDGMYDARIGDARLIDWITDIVLDRGSSHAGL